MNICIFHNLKQGGAISYLLKLTAQLQINNTVDVYSFQNNTNKKIFKNYYKTKIRKTKNIIEHLIQINFEMYAKSKKLSKKILNKKYDLIIVNNDHLVQSPHILKYLGKENNCVFISHETKREFYEKTTYDHNNIKKILSRLIRISTKYIDLKNCKNTKNIITNSQYSKYVFRKIYKKNSYVVYPGLNRKKISKNKYTPNNTYISFGALSKLKGHDLSIKYKPTNSKMYIVGNNNNDKNYLVNKYNNEAIFSIDISESEKEKTMSSNSIFFANQRNEPFGISTLELTSKGRFVIGLNSGGTPEIIDSGINGILYPKDNNIPNKVLKYITKINEFNLYKNKEISWKKTTENLLRLYNFLKNEPAY